MEMNIVWIHVMPKFMLSANSHVVQIHIQFEIMLSTNSSESEFK